MHNNYRQQMNQYQSTLYQLTESVGAVSMVSVDQIKTQENLDYLEHLCTFIDRMNINPIWFENEDQNNKAKILEIYQLAITYSSNLTNSYQRTIQEKQAEIRTLRETEREKTRLIRDHKDDYQSLKERYKLKKHQMYKFMYDNLRNKIKEEDSFRDTRRDHRDQRSELPPEIVYYYPQPNDPAFHNYPPYPAQMPPQQYDPRMWPPPNQPLPHPAYPNYPDNIHQPPFSSPYLSVTPSAQPGPPTLGPESTYKHFLNSGNYMQAQDRPQLVLTNSKIISPKNIKLESPKSDAMEKSHIIASGEKLYEKMDKQIKEKSQKSISKESGAKKKESIRLEQRSEDEDFGDLTVNSKKKDNSIKLSKKDSGYEQEQFDSIAHIKLGSQSSAKNIGITPAATNKRFQSKIYGKQEKQINAPNPSSKITQLTEENQHSSYQNVNSVMQSNFSRNSGQPQGQRLFEGQNRPKRSSQANNTKAEEGKAEDMKKSNSSKNAQKSNNPSPPKVPQPETPTEKGDKSIDIYKSNVGRAESHKQDIPKGRDPIDIYSSNMGHGSNFSKNSQAEKLFSNNSRPKRIGQGQSPSPSPSPSPNLEVPEVKKSHANQLKISVAESEEMRASNMLYSQANSISFPKEQGKTPPRLQKPEANEEDEVYEDDFDIDDIEQLEKSHLPISQNRPPPKMPQKSEVNIDISSIPTIKDIVKDRYAKLPNETFELKANPANLNPPKIAASSTLSESDNFFDEILQMPMNSRIAKRPTIHKFQSSSFITKPVQSLQKILDSGKIEKDVIKESQAVSSLPQQGVQSVESLKKLIDSGKINSSFGGAISPSIRVIDPAGHMERLQSRGLKEEQASTEGAIVANFGNERTRLNSSNSSNLADFNTDSITLMGKHTSLLNQNFKENEKVLDASNSQEDEEIDFDIMEESSMKPNSRPKNEDKPKLQAAISKIESQPPAYKDSRGFDEAWFDRILKDQFKTKTNDIKSAEKWEDIEQYYKKQYEKLKELQSKSISERIKEEKSENASTPKSIQRESNYDDLQYSQSNAKFENKSFKGQVKRQTSLDPVLDMSESITIKDLPKVEEKAAPKNVQNKYSRSGKAKVEVKGDLSKNLNAGKNAYDVDDPLNVAAFQNKRLLEQQEESQSDF